MMKFNIFEVTQENENYREVLATGVDSQIVIMRIKPGEDVGEEVYQEVDQIVVVVDGKAEVTEGTETDVLGPEEMVFIPAGSRHNMVNIGDTDLKIFTIYAPPEHDVDDLVEEKSQDINEESYDENPEEEEDSFNDNY
jgi:mannose-6-phosphate isomerase-like protein (cupin superfamily)